MRASKLLPAVLILGAAVVVAPGVSDAQAVARPARVGYLDPGGSGSGPVTSNVGAPFDRAFVERLRELGWMEGQNLVLEIRRAEGRADTLTALVSELVQRRVNAIVTSGTTAVRAARQVTDTVPIVMVGAGDPVASGFVKSLARQGGNVTGVSSQGQELVPKALSLLREIVPRAKRVDLLANAANPANAFFARVTAEAGGALGLEIRLLEIRQPDELEPAIRATQADALLMLADPMFILHAKRIAEVAIKRRLPLASFGPAYVEAGSLMSYANNRDEMFRLAANFTDRILRGARPADLPVEQPSRLDLMFNLTTARALGVTIPQSLLLRADRVFQ